MRPHYSQSSRENVTPSDGTSPLASYKEVPPPRLTLTSEGTDSTNFSIYLFFFVARSLVLEDPEEEEAEGEAYYLLPFSSLKNNRYR